MEFSSDGLAEMRGAAMRSRTRSVVTGVTTNGGNSGLKFDIERRSLMSHYQLGDDPSKDLH